MNNHDSMDRTDTGTTEVQGIAPDDRKPGAPGCPVQGGMAQTDGNMPEPAVMPAEASSATPLSGDTDTPPVTVVEVSDSDEEKADRAVRVAALPPERAHRQDRSVILREARVRILESKAPAPSQGMDGRTKIQTSPHKSGKWTRRIKRLGWAIGGSILLASVGTVMMLTVGDSGLSSMKTFIEKAWVPAFIARLSVYLVLAWWVWPVIMRRARNQALARLQALRHDLLAENPIDHYAVDAVEAQMRQANDTWISSVVVMGILLVIELVFVQLPYLLMQ